MIQCQSVGESKHVEVQSWSSLMAAQLQLISIVQSGPQIQFKASDKLAQTGTDMQRRNHDRQKHWTDVTRLNNIVETKGEMAKRGQVLAELARPAIDDGQQSNHVLEQYCLSISGRQDSLQAADRFHCFIQRTHCALVETILVQTYS